MAYKTGVMPRLVFDIETSAVGLEHFDEVQQEYLFREAARQPTEEDKARKRVEISQQFSLWPFTAQVVCIAMINADSGKGQVLYQSDDFDEDALEEADTASQVVALEREVIGQERTLLGDLARQLDGEQDLAAAVASVRSLMFLGRFRSDIHRRMEALES